MKGQKNLKKLLSIMQPILHEGEYIFLTEQGIDNNQLSNVKQKSMMQFLEQEGVTFIINREDFSGKYNDLTTWAWIEIGVHSDLEAVGFLAAITTELAKYNISVNTVSAYYHDHLFVPQRLKEKAMECLEKLMGCG